MSDNFACQIFLPSGTEFVHDYQPRNLISQQTVFHKTNPNGRLYPSNEYKGKFQWHVVDSGINFPWRGIRIIRHGDGSIQWKYYTWNNTGDGVPPSGSEMVSCFFQIFGVVER